MKFKLILQILFLSSFSYIMQAASNLFICDNVSNDVYALDSSNNSLQATIATDNDPLAIISSPDGTTVYVCNQSGGMIHAGDISVIDTTSYNVFSSAAGLLNGPVAIAITPDGAKAYVCNQQGNSVSVMTIPSFSLLITIAVGNGPFAIAITPDGARAYVCNVGDNSISVIDTTSNTVSGTINFGNNPCAIAITPDGATAYVCNAGGNSVSLIDIPANSVSRTISVGGYPKAIAITPDGTKAYVCNALDNTVSVIDTSTYAVSGPISVGNMPGAIAITPDGRKAYVCNAGGNSVSVIDIPANIVSTTFSCGMSPSALCFLPFRGPTGPTANAQSVGVFENVTKGIILTGSGGTAPYTFAIVSNPTHGTLSGFNAATGAVTYTPNTGYVGPDSFTFTITDSTGTTSPAGTVTLTIENLVAQPQTVRSLGTLATGITLTGIGGTAPYTFAIISNPTHGNLTGFNPATGAVTYTSIGLYAGVDTFTFTVTDNLGVVSLAGTITLHVISPLPLANPTSANVVQGTSVTMTLTGTHVSGSGGFTFALGSNPNYGTLSGFNPSTGVVTYTSHGTYIGLDTFTFTVTDNKGTCAIPGTANVQILPESTRAYVGDANSQLFMINVSSGSFAGKVTNIPSYGKDILNIVFTPDHTKAYVAYSGIDNVSVIDLSRNTYLYDVYDPLGYLGGFYSNLAISPDGTLAYVCNSFGSGNRGLNVFSPKNNPVDVITGHVQDPLGYIHSPISVMFTPDGTRAYVVNEYYGVSMIDANSNSGTYNQAIANIPMSGTFTDIVISPDGNFAYVCDVTSNSVVIIDTNPNSGTYNTVVGLIDTNGYPFNNPYQMAISPDGLHAYVGNSYANNLSVIDLNPANVATYQKVTQYVTGSILEPYSLAFSADGLQAYVVGLLGGANPLYIIDVPSNTVVQALSGYSNLYSVGFSGSGAPFFALTNNKVLPTASALDSTTGIMYEVGNAQDGSGDLAIMASSVSASSFGQVASFTKTGQATGGLVLYSTNSLLNIGGTSFTQLDMALQSVNGVSKIIVSGSNNLLNKGFVARFNTIPVANSLDGVLDDTFGDYQNGTSGPKKGYTIFNGVGQAAGFSSFSACNVDSNQKVVVAGSVGVGGGAATGQILLVRYTLNGSLDTTFGPIAQVGSPQLGYGYSAILGLSGSGYSAIINDIEFDTLKNIYLVGQYQAPLIPAPGLSSNGVAGTSPFICKFVQLGVPDQTFYNQFGTFMIPIQYVNGQGIFTKCVNDINPISGLSSATMYTAGDVKNLKTSPAKDYATMVRFTIATLNLSSSQAYLSGNSGAPLKNLQGNICPSLVVPAFTQVAQISGAQGSAVTTYNSIQTSADIQNVLNVSGIVYNLQQSLQASGATAAVAQSIGTNFQNTIAAVVNAFVAQHSGNLLQNFLYLSRDVAINECLLTTNVSKFIYLQLIYAAEKAIQINIKTAASYCTSPLNSPYA